MTSVSNMEAGNNQNPQLCNNCDTSLSKYWCLECNGSLCEDCKSAHSRVSVTKFHQVCSQPHPQTQPSNTPVLLEYCRVHRTEPLELFCFTCNKFTCKDCQLATHRSHRHEFVRNVVSAWKNQLECYVTPIATRKEVARRSLEEMNKRVQTIEQEKEKVKKQLLNCFMVLLKQAKANMKEVFNQTLSVYKKETEQVLSRIEKLKQVQQIYFTVSETAEKARQSQDLLSLINHTKQISSSLKEVLNQDLNPPPMMTEVKISLDHTSRRAMSDFAKMEVLQVPFSTSTENNAFPFNFSVPSSEIIATALTRDCLITLKEMASSSSQAPPSYSSSFPASLTATQNDAQPKAGIQEPSPQPPPPNLSAGSSLPSPLNVSLQGSSRSLNSSPSSASSSSPSTQSNTSPFNLSTNSNTTLLNLSSSQQVQSNTRPSGDHASCLQMLSQLAQKTGASRKAASSSSVKKSGRVMKLQENIELSFHSLLTSQSSSSPSFSALPTSTQSRSKEPRGIWLYTPKVLNKTNTDVPTIINFSTQTSSSPVLIKADTTVAATIMAAATATTTPSATATATTTNVTAAATATAPTSNLQTVVPKSRQTVTPSKLVQLLTTPQTAGGSLQSIPAVPNLNLVKANVSYKTIHYIPVASNQQTLSTIKNGQPVPLSTQNSLRHLQAPLVNNPAAHSSLANITLHQAQAPLVNSTAQTTLYNNPIHHSQAHLLNNSAYLTFSNDLLQAPLVNSPAAHSSLANITLHQAHAPVINNSAQSTLSNNILCHSQAPLQNNSAYSTHSNNLVQAPLVNNSAQSTLSTNVLQHVQAPLVNRTSPVVVAAGPHATVVPVTPILPDKLYTVLSRDQLIGNTNPLVSNPVRRRRRANSAASAGPSVSTQNISAAGVTASTLDHDMENEPTSTMMDQSKESTRIKRATTVFASEEREPAEDEPTSTVPEDPETTENEMMCGSSEETFPTEHDITDTYDETNQIASNYDENMPVESTSSPESPGSEVLPASRWQPIVLLNRLPLPLSGRRKLPRFRLLLGKTTDEIYLQEIEVDSKSESDSDDDLEEILDFVEPLSSPGTTISMEVLSCCVCISSDSLIICSSCARGFHRECHIPPIKKDIDLSWTCSICQDLSNPADPYRSERTWIPQSPGLSLQTQRGCECLLLFLKVECSSRLSKFSSWSHLERISQRLTLQRPPAYETAEEFISNIWTVFKDASQDEALMSLQLRFQQKVEETLSLEVPLIVENMYDNPKMKNLKRKLKDLLSSMEPKKTKE